MSSLPVLTQLAHLLPKTAGALSSPHLSGPRSSSGSGLGTGHPIDSSPNYAAAGQRAAQQYHQDHPTPLQPTGPRLSRLRPDTAPTTQFTPDQLESGEIGVGTKNKAPQFSEEQLESGRVGSGWNQSLVPASPVNFSANPGADPETPVQATPPASMPPPYPSEAPAAITSPPSPEITPEATGGGSIPPPPTSGFPVQNSLLAPATWGTPSGVNTPQVTPSAPPAGVNAPSVASQPAPAAPPLVPAAPVAAPNKSIQVAGAPVGAVGTTSYADQINQGKIYGGKVDQAAQQAQAYRDTHPEVPFIQDLNKIHDPHRFQVGTPEAVQQLAKVPDAEALWNSRQDTAYFDKAPDSSVVLHEFAHSTQVGPGGDAALNFQNRFAATSDKGTPQYNSYLATPREAEERMIALKHLYSKDTGRTINSPEEAQAALQYYGFGGGGQGNPQRLSTDDLQDFSKLMNRGNPATRQEFWNRAIQSLPGLVRNHPSPFMNPNTKNANPLETLLGDPRNVRDIAKDFALPALILGGGAAGVINLAAQVRQQTEEAKLRRQRVNPADNPDTLVVRIPTSDVGTAKVAAPSPGVLKSLGLFGGTLIGGATLLGGAAASNQLYADHQAAQPASGDYLRDAGLAVLMGVPAFGLGYGVVNQGMKMTRKAQMQTRLDKAKAEYSTLLGNQLAENSGNPIKQAGLDPDTCFPILKGIINQVAAQGFSSKQLMKEAKPSASSLAISALTTGGTALAALAAHQWMYNRQKEVEALHTKESPKPPKNIRIISVPAAPPVQAALPVASVTESWEPLDSAQQAQLAQVQQEWSRIQGVMDQSGTPQPKLAIDLMELAGGAAVAGSLGEKGSKTPKGPRPLPKARELNPGTIEISRGEGDEDNTIIQATDPASAAVLKRNSSKLTRLMGVLQESQAAE